MEIGIVYDPMRDELFSAERGEGASLNGRRIQVSPVNGLSAALLCTGFPYDVRERSEFARHFANFSITAPVFRRDGPADRHLGRVVCDRFAGVLGVWRKPRCIS